MALAIEHDDAPGLTEDEQVILRSFRALWDAFSALPQLHPADREEAAFHLHALTRIVGMRAAHRAHPELISHRSAAPI
jgi:hypothetical protein